MRLSRDTFSLLAALAVAAGCQSSGYSKHSGFVPDPPAERAAQLPPAALAEGRMVYANKCAKCHKFYDPAKYDNAEWRMWMRKMSKKARLTESEDALLAKYLALYRPAKEGRVPANHAN